MTDDLKAALDAARDVYSAGIGGCYDNCPDCARKARAAIVAFLERVPKSVSYEGVFANGQEWTATMQFSPSDILAALKEIP